MSSANSGASTHHLQQQQKQQSHYATSSMSSLPSTGGIGVSHGSSVQRQIQQDWSNREYIEVIVSNIKRLTDFLNSFELSCKSKLAILDEKMNKLEMQIDYVEARVTKGETLN